MLTSKQRTFLRAQAHLLEPVVQIGKLGITEAAVRQVAEQLRAHELIKVRFAREAPVGARDAGADLATQSESELIQCTGRIIVLYRRHEKKPKIALPGTKAFEVDESAERKRDPRLSLRRRHAENRKKASARGTKSTGSGRVAKAAAKASGPKAQSSTPRSKAAAKTRTPRSRAAKSRTGQVNEAD